MAFIDTKDIYKLFEKNGVAHLHVSDIDVLPRADVVEVKHGKWINDPPYMNGYGYYSKSQECSVCHAVFVSDGNTPYSNHPYCCECGAKMDGGAE